jgi:hypothetical protein
MELRMKNEWHLFQIRRALLTSSHIALAPKAGISHTFRVPELRTAAASILYVNLVSLLEDAIETRLTAEERSDRNLKLNGRLKRLWDRGDLKNYDALDHIRSRRNEIGHEFGKDATPEEFNSACIAVEDQLVEWQLIGGGPAYTLYWEASAMRATQKPDYSYERDYIVRVMNGDNVVAESKSVLYFE